MKNDKSALENSAFLRPTQSNIYFILVVHCSDPSAGFVHTLHVSRKSIVNGLCPSIARGKTFYLSVMNRFIRKVQFRFEVWQNAFEYLCCIFKIEIS